VATDAAELDNHVTHTREVLDAIDQIRINTLSIEYNTQGFRFTGELARLADRDVASIARKKALEQLAKLTARSIEQQDRFASLQEVLKQRMAIAKRVEELVRTIGSQAANEYVRTVPLRETRERVYQILGDMEVQERTTLEADRNAQASARNHMVTLGVSLTVLLLLVLMTNYYMVIRQFKRIRVAQSEVAASEGSLSITLQSIGDGVVATDTQANITRMNTVAELLTGWPVELARGKHIAEVFNVIHEKTRQPAVIPVTEVLATGQIRMLANHTLLIARDGSERPIADSASPIHDATGQIQGVVLVFRDVTVEYKAEQTIKLQKEILEQRVEDRTRQLQESEVRYRTAFMTCPEPIVLSRLSDGSYLDVNIGFERTFGWSRNEVIGKTSLELGIWRKMEDRLVFIRMVDEMGMVDDFETEFLTKQGSVVASLVSSNTISIDGQSCILTVVRDITKRKNDEEQLRSSEARRSIATNSGRIAIWEVDLLTGNLTWDDNCFLLYRIDKQRFNSTFEEWKQAIHPQDLDTVTKSFQNAVDGIGEYDLTFRILWPNGEVRYIEAHGEVQRDQDGGALRMIGTNWDVTTIKTQQTQLELIAHFDALTNLPNRVLLADRLQQSMLQCQRRSQKLAVAFMDLDGFKAINDQFGHAVGDQVLIGLANRMNEVMRQGDTLARLGGDEFVAVLIDLEEQTAIEPLLDRLLAAAAQLIHVDGHSLHVSASIGVTIYPQTIEIDADQLLRQADQSMYQAKLAGKNRYHIFDAMQDSSIRGLHESLEQIRLALKRRQFVLYYQPKVNMRTGQVFGAEALIRWQHPEQGLLAPGAFLPVIEDHPLAVDIGEWVIDAALIQMEIWISQGMDLRVSVNIGARQLQQENFVERLRTILAMHPSINPNTLELEILETSALEDIAQISQVIEDCAQLGVSFALDDFGTGYSSLTYLKRLRVKTLKIDQSFVRDMLDDPDDLAILQGVIGLAGALRREVIAEGVETPAHGTALLQLGCELAQGYGIARPMPADQLLEWAATWTPNSTWSDLPWLGGDLQSRFE
jgi:diguanylate cyclase (GGDEF)-like protein/PAS domain S-box-containing protein